MKTLIALKTIYHDGIRIKAGAKYDADEYVAKNHIRGGLAREVGPEKTKVAGPEKTKGNDNVADTGSTKASRRKAKRRA